MKNLKNITMILLLLFAVACVPPAPKEKDLGQQNANNTNNPTPTPAATPTPIINEQSCRLSDLGLSSTLGSPTSIRQAVDLINALPKPTSLKCFIQSLNKPLKIALTESNLSVQPGDGAESPRIFIFKSWLIMSVSLVGPGSWYLEFSEMKTSASSYKGELLFPIAETVAYSEPFDRIVSSGTPGTTCRGCHGQEVSDTYPGATNAFRSIVLKPEPFNDVTLVSLNISKSICQSANNNSRRCQMIESLFDNSTGGNGAELMPTQGSFPIGTPTLFESIQP